MPPTLHLHAGRVLSGGPAGGWRCGTVPVLCCVLHMRLGGAADKAGAQHRSCRRPGLRRSITCSRRDGMLALWCSALLPGRCGEDACLPVRRMRRPKCMLHAARGTGAAEHMQPQEELASLRVQRAGGSPLVPHLPAAAERPAGLYTTVLHCINGRRICHVTAVVRLSAAPSERSRKRRSRSTPFVPRRCRGGRSLALERRSSSQDGWRRSAMHARLRVGSMRQHEAAAACRHAARNARAAPADARSSAAPPTPQRTAASGARSRGDGGRHGCGSTSDAVRHAPVQPESAHWRRGGEQGAAAVPRRRRRSGRRRRRQVGERAAPSLRTPRRTVPAPESSQPLRQTLRWRRGGRQETWRR